MNTLKSLLTTYHHLTQPCHLATIVKTQGSTYRRPGARMLILNSGEMIGLISGGCLENDIWHHLQNQRTQSTQKLEQIAPFLLTYDTHTNEDILWGFGLGCDGIVHILIEPLYPNETPHNQALRERGYEARAASLIPPFSEIQTPLNPLNWLDSTFKSQQPSVLATVLTTTPEDSSLPNHPQLGDRLALAENGTCQSTIAHPQLQHAIHQDAKLVLQNQRSKLQQYPLEQGTLEVFLEFIQPPVSLILIGAGRDALPVTQIAQQLGWQTTIIDCRGQDKIQQRFGAIADQVILTRRDLLAETLKQTVINPKRTAIVILSHNYWDDLEALRCLLPTAIAYLGILGSRQRTQRLLAELPETISSLATGRLHTPVGLDIGAETPEEIALAIVAEIQKVMGTAQ